MASGPAVAPDNMERRMSNESVVQAILKHAEDSNGVRINSGHMLYGAELEEFCSQRGLCPLCGKVKIKRKSFKLFRKSKWENLTVKSRRTGKYKVYKGYCLREGCFSLDQVRRITNTKGTTHAQRPRYPKRWSSEDDGYPLGDDDTVVTATPGQAEYRFPSDDLKDELRQNPKHVDDRIPLSIVQATIRELSKNDMITILDLSMVGIRTCDMRMLVSFFEENTSLQQLILESCQIDDEQAVLLGGGLEAASDMPLTKLYLKSNMIGDLGMESICNYLESSPTLEKFDISKNECSSMGGVKVFKALSANPLTKIVALNLSQNKIWNLDEDRFGVGSFLSKNRTLRVLNLEGNYIHVEGVKAIARGLVSNPQCALERLYLGFNSIGDDGAIILANVLERNTKLTYLGLAENAIGNPGGRALLSAMDTNKTISEITGLWRNNIDRRFIVVAIRRLLLAHDRTSKRRQPLEAPKVDPPPIPPRPPTPPASPEQPKYKEEPSVSSGDVGFGSLRQTPSSSQTPSIASSVPSQVTPDGFPVQQSPNGKNGIHKVNGVKSPKKSPKRDPNLPVDRLTLFQSAPLAYFDKFSGAHRGIPLIDYRQEEAIVTQSVSYTVDSAIEVSIKTATPANLSNFLQEKENRVLHFSCHGHPDHIPLENGFGLSHDLTYEGLAKVIAVNNSNLNVVFVSSCHAHSIGQAFVAAGAKHVVCCQREDNFQDPVASEFIQVFYQALARDLTLQQAFDSAKKSVIGSMHAINKRNLRRRFRLLPEIPEVENFHKVPVFFTGMPPKSALGIRKKLPQLPKLPKYFVGREVDIFEILQALRVEDLVRINGPPGHGKESVVAALSDYAIQRTESFGVDDVFWLPPMPGVVPVKDSLYGDLCQCVATLQDSSEDIWDKSERLMECRDRIDIEMENMKPLLIVDDALISFVSDGAQSGFERFLSHLMNVSAAKVIKVMSGGETSSAISKTSMVSQGSKIEEPTFEINPLDFRSTAKLYGGISNFISSSGCPAAHTASEFAELAEPPFITRISKPSSVVSQRRSDLYARMGSGIPAATVAIAQGQSKKAFIELIKIANIPEVHVDTLGALEKTLDKMTRMRTAAIKEHNYLRALDLDRIIEEIQEMRPEFPTLDELKMEEEVLKADLAEAIGNKNYDEAASIKKELLLLKKKISRERTKANEAIEATDRMDEVQMQIKNMIEDVRLEDVDQAVTFVIDGIDDSKSSLVIGVGEVQDFQPSYPANGIVVWANESCTLGGNPMHDNLLEKGGSTLVNDIQSLPIVIKTGHGPVRCGTGNAVIVGPEQYGKLGTPCLILAVGPLSPHNMEDAVDDETDTLHHIKMMLRSSYRSTLILARHAGLQALALNLLTTRKTGKAYRETVQIGLRTLVEEAQFCSVKHYQVMASSPNEAALLAGLMTEMGYQKISPKTYEL